MKPHGEKDIADRLCADMDLVGESHEVVGVFIQGSQNYHLEYEGSDIDTKAIVLPSFHDLIFNTKPASYTIVLPSDEHIDVKDIRLMFDLWKKQNVQFTELLFSRYYATNPAYEDIVKNLIDNREMIAHADTHAMVSCMVGVMHEKQHALCHPYPAVADKIEKYGYDPKQLHHIFRLKDFMQRYAAGEPFGSALIAHDPEFLIAVKRDPPLYSLQEATESADELVSWADEFKKEFQKTHPRETVNLDELFNTQLETALSRYYTEELLNKEQDMALRE